MAADNGPTSSLLPFRALNRLADQFLRKVRLDRAPKGAEQSNLGRFACWKRRYAARHKIERIPVDRKLWPGETPRGSRGREYRRQNVSGYWRNSPSDGLPTCEVLRC